MRYRRRGFHYLGNLGSKLADLQGYASLAHELIQNADDVVPGARWIRFHIADQALIVDNGGVFKSCGDLEADDCPWLEDGIRKKRCDFHRFAWIGSGDKREEQGTTGAFGLGFLTVYQITDMPEIISAGQHWILDELAPEEQRIGICSGCPKCLDDSLPATRFILPWARDPDSLLRKALRAQAFGRGDEDSLLASFTDLLPPAMIFLRRLELVQLVVRDQPVLDLSRIAEDADVLVESGTSTQFWRLYQGSFDTEAQLLRQRYPGKIEDKRSANVVVAFGESRENGRLFAWLPTQQSSGLPCHINADFYPTNDRKDILSETDYRSEWNRVALRAAAGTIGSHVEGIRDQIKHAALWEMFEAGKTLDGGPRDSLRCFWPEFLSALRHRPVVFTQAGMWCKAADCVVVDPAHRESLRAIEALGLAAVHEDLDPRRNLLTNKTDGAGVPVLRLSILNERLGRLGIANGTSVEGCPPVLRDSSLRDELWTLLEAFLANRQTTADERAQLSKLPLVLGCDDHVWSPATVFRADEETTTLIRLAGIPLPILASTDDCPNLAELSPGVSVAAVLSSLEQSHELDVDGDGGLEPGIRVALLGWFGNRNSVFEKQPDLRRRLAALPVFPSGHGFWPLARLSLPGSFHDPLGVADVVDTARVRALVPFLEQLGARPLTIREYIIKHVPLALENERVTTELRRHLVNLLVDRLGEFRDDRECLRALQGARVVECVDGTFVRPADAYFGSEALKLLTGYELHVAIIPADRAEATVNLFETLGVAKLPRLKDLRDVLTRTTCASPTSESRDLVRHIFEHLGRRLSAEEAVPAEIDDLRTRKWLPGQRDQSRWWAPHEIAAIYNQDLFATQTEFLELDRTTQNACSNFVKLLGIQSFPTVQQVVRHLRQCSRDGTPVSEGVYQRLSEEGWSQDPALEILVGTPCIYLPGRGYVAPRCVFWSDPGFGRYRFVLSAGLKNYGRFLERVGVRHLPSFEDAIDVLAEIADDPANKGRSLDDDTRRALHRCWDALAAALNDGSVHRDKLAVLSDKTVVADTNGLLNKPQLLFFEDRPNLADHFRTSLGSNVIGIPERTAEAMEAAGVRRLSHHIKVEILEADDRNVNFWLKKRIDERRDQLRRAATAAGFASQSGEEWSRLDELSVDAATRLLVRYVFEGFGRPMFSDPQPVRAVHKAGEALIVEFLDGKPSWPDIARETALVVYPDLEPGRVAGIFHQVLAPESQEDVDALLDALGVPRLVPVAVQTPTGLVPPVEAIGTSSGFDVLPVPPLPPPPVPPQAVQPPQHVPSVKRPTQRPRSRYVTYVVPPDAEPTPPTSDDRSDADRAVEQAGIRLVKAHEEARGRHPRVMEPCHEGYDIESDGLSGEVERYIEVKSIGGAWGQDGVPLTAPEFRTAQALGVRYWLYVVEDATSNEYSIYRVQDPAGKANRFFFDRGWRQVAEPD